MFNTYPVTHYAPYETEPMKMRCGTVTFRIEGAEYDPNGGTPQGGTVTVESFDKIEYAFDVPDSEEDPTSIEVQMGGTEVVLWDQVQLDDGTWTSLHETLYAADFGRFPFECSITVQNGAEEAVFEFNFGYEDIGFDQTTRKVTIEMQGTPPEVIDEPLSTTIPNCATARSFETGEVDQSAQHQAAPFNEVLQRYFELRHGVVYDVPLDPVILDSYFLDDSSYVNGFGWWVWHNPINPTPDDVTLVTQIASAAALEGAIYGYAFGKGFFVSRTLIDPNLQVTLDQDQFDNLEIVERRNINFAEVAHKTLLFMPEDNVGQGDAIYWNYTNLKADPANRVYLRYNPEYLIVGSDEETFASLKEERFNIVFSRQRLAYVSYDPISEELSQTGRAAFETAHEELSEYGRIAYSKFLGASGPLRIKITGGWGIFNLKPYESFRVTGADVSSIVKGVDFRISEIKYDLTKDKFEVEAYEI